MFVLLKMAAPPAVALVRLLDELNQEDDFFCNDESEREKSVIIYVLHTYLREDTYTTNWVF